MKIKEFEVRGLHGSKDTNIRFSLNENLNILTGRNGSNKTTILRLLWYMVSPNIEHACNEIDFDYAHILTDTYALTINNTFDNNSEAKYTDRILFRPFDNNEYREEFSKFEKGMPKRILAERYSEFIDYQIVNVSNGSLYFPTFRRIEQSYKHNSRISQRDEMAEIAGRLSRYADQLSFRNHRFVASVSTDDIERLIAEKYAGVSEETGKRQSKLLDDILKLLSDIDTENDPEDFARRMLTNLQEMKSNVTDANEYRDRLFKPFSVLQDFINSLFSNKQAEISSNVIFHTSDSDIQPEALSAGEKQMLSFLMYNAFYESVPIIIDEPELSLHVDWQRQLFKTLLSQNSNNQFIIATHSPFIYSNYPEYEIQIGSKSGE
jgi:predicted ATP-binding protein involved in virulence